MDWNIILQWSFLIALVTAGIRLAVPVLLAVLGEIITERSGILNLGLEGIMAVGGLAGFSTAYYLENNAINLIGRPLDGASAAWIGLLAGMLAGALMGWIMAFMSISLGADQVITGITLVLFGVGISDYLYRQGLSSLTARINGLPAYPIPLLNKIPVIGEIFFNQPLPAYLTFILVVGVWFLLFRTTWGMRIRAVGENPAAADTSGVSVERVRYAATLLGAALVGLGGAVLTVVQLKLYREGIIAGRGWIAVALVIFARWQPSMALVGALLFGLADSLQFRIQALGGDQGIGAIPYEFLLMLPYLLTLLVVANASLFRTRQKIRTSDQPAALGQPYVKGSK